jgi:hypothetical protein
MEQEFTHALNNNEYSYSYKVNNIETTFNKKNELDKVVVMMSLHIHGKDGSLYNPEIMMTKLYNFNKLGPRWMFSYDTQKWRKIFLVVRNCEDYFMDNIEEIILKHKAKDQPVKLSKDEICQQFRQMMTKLGKELDKYRMGINQKLNNCFPLIEAYSNIDEQEYELLEHLEKYIRKMLKEITFPNSN